MATQAEMKNPVAMWGRVVRYTPNNTPIVEVAMNNGRAKEVLGSGKPAHFQFDQSRGNAWQQVKFSEWLAKQKAQEGDLPLDNLLPPGSDPPQGVLPVDKEQKQYTVRQPSDQAIVDPRGQAFDLFDKMDDEQISALDQGAIIEKMFYTLKFTSKDGKVTYSTGIAAFGSMVMAWNHNKLNPDNPICYSEVEIDNINTQLLKDRGQYICVKVKAWFKQSPEHYEVGRMAQRLDGVRDIAFALTTAETKARRNAVLRLADPEMKMKAVVRYQEYKKLLRDMGGQLRESEVVEVLPAPEKAPQKPAGQPAPQPTPEEQSVPAQPQTLVSGEPEWGPLIVEFKRAKFAGDPSAVKVINAFLSGDGLDGLDGLHAASKGAFGETECGALVEAMVTLGDPEIPSKLLKEVQIVAEGLSTTGDSFTPDLLAATLEKVVYP